MVYTDFGFKYSPPSTTEMNKCKQKTEIPKWMKKGKTTLIHKDSLGKNAPKLYAYNLPTDDVKNTNATN